MKLELVGHGYKYAVEQIMLMFFPEERPEYAPVSGDGPSARIALSEGRSYVTAVTTLHHRGTHRGVARAETRLLGDPLERDRVLQRILKLSFYKAAVEATGIEPVWGALTGIRPGKLAEKYLLAGMGPERAAREMTRVYRTSPERAALCVQAAEEALRIGETLGPRDAAVYLGVPFCPTRCAYCSFVSHSVEKSLKLVEPFVEALEREIDAVGALAAELGIRIVSVYFGGGTPTTLSPEQLRRVIVRLRGAFDLGGLREFTVEAGRPDTITEEKLAALRDGGVDRVSVNPQTMSDRVLEAIGRRHTARDVYDAMEKVRGAGFTSVNMDLIAGLPEDSPAGFADTLEKVIALEPENVTVHTLSLKKGTRITLEGTAIPDGAAVAEMLDTARRGLTGAGYAPYYLYRQKFMSGGFENVGWSRPGHVNLYNVLIMEELCTILALGGGGVTKLVAPSVGRIERVFNAKYPYEYIGSIDRELESKEKIRAFYRRKYM